MFDKKCPGCNNKIKKNYEFCPFCGNNFRNIYDKEDYGIIGKNDILNEPIFPGFGNSMFEKLLSQTMKMLEKQMKTMGEEMNPPFKKIPINEINPNLNVQFFVNGKKVFPQVEEIIAETCPQPSRVKVNKMSEEKLGKFAKLKRIEPHLKMRRLGQKLIYELEVPGVKNLDDVLINRLESSIEVKALAKDKSYSKIINVNLPILRYGLNNGNLILELQA
jgi:HSP20 family molecular chaperone IbpA